jgi:hypothetical protein
MKKILFMMLAVTVMTSCSKFELLSDEDMNVNGAEVKLRGAISEIESRAGAGVVTTIPTAGLTTKVFRADMSTAATPVYSTYNTTAITGTLTSAGAFTMSPTQYFYPNAARKTKYISVYPSDGTFSNTAGTVTFPALDGKTDVMCSNTVEGDTKNPTLAALTFQHFLTKIDVKVVMKSGETLADVQAMWGTITSIKLKSKSIGVVVTLPAPTAATTTVATIAAASGTAGDMSLWTSSHAVPATGIAIPATATSYGYAMFLPVTTAAKLSFDITTTQGGTITAETTAAATYPAAKNCGVTITFSLTGVAASAGVGGISGLGSFGSGGENTVNI